jgi:hypothetical protein
MEFVLGRTAPARGGHPASSERSAPGPRSGLASPGGRGGRRAKKNYGGKLSWSRDRGRGGWLRAPPPSKPDGRISRIGLSSRWFTSERIDATSMGSFQAREPLLATQRLAAPGVPQHESRQQPLWPRQRFAPSRVWARGLSGVDSPMGTTTGLVCCLGHRVSTALHPFAPPALLGFVATMGALTPGRPALRFPLRAREHRLWRRPGLPAFWHRVFRSFRLQPPLVVPAWFWVLHTERTGPPCSGRPLQGRASVGLRRWGAGSPRRQAESSSLALRTNRSPPVALHPASRRRSYRRLRDARTSRQGLSPC